MLNAPFFRRALATDINLGRAPKEHIPTNVTFNQVDAKQIGSLVDKGLLIIVASWRMDKRMFDPLLQSRPCREYFSLKQRITKGAIEGMLLEKKA